MTPGAPVLSEQAGRWLERVILVVVTALINFSLGRLTAPPKVEVREVVKVEWKDRVVEKVVTRKAKAVDRVVYVDRVVSPEGEVREKRVTTTKADTREVADLGRTTESTGKAEAVISNSTPKPDWRVGVLVGASLREPLVPIAGPLVLGANVERRILGPVSLGAWATTGGAAGASLSAEF